MNFPLRIRLPIYLKREGLTLLLLTALAAALLALVSAISSIFHAQQDALAQRWSARGSADLDAGRYSDAVNDFRAALRYAEDSHTDQLGLAESLIGLKRTSEASAYLKNLWAVEPENGLVNRELARIAAGNGDTRGALRYYHNSIYAIWTGDAEIARRNTRWELIKYLLTIKAPAQAQSELIALAAEVGDDPVQQVHLGQYFLKVQDPQHALQAFRLTLKVDPHSANALAGAGAAAFGLGDYPLAEHYLHAAVQENPADSDSATLHEVAEEVLRLDPFRRQISDAERDRAVVSLFSTAGNRLQSCPAAAASPIVPGASQNLGDAFNSIKPQVTERDLRRNQDIVNQALNLAFNIERQAASACGAGKPADTALLLISKLHEGS